MADSTLQRFIDSAQTAIGHGALTDQTGGHVNVERFRRAIPIARSIVLFADPLDSCSDALNEFIKAEQAAVDAEPDVPTDPDHECGKSAAEQDAVYYVALAVGLLIADQVRS